MLKRVVFVVGYFNSSQQSRGASWWKARGGFWGDFRMAEGPAQQMYKKQSNNKKRKSLLRTVSHNIFLVLKVW